MIGDDREAEAFEQTAERGGKGVGIGRFVIEQARRNLGGRVSSMMNVHDFRQAATEATTRDAE